MKVIDFHSHILPGVDHGCKNVAECTKQFEIISSSFVDTVVATSHFYPYIHTIEAFSEKVENALTEIEKSPVQHSPLLCIGAEVLLCEGLNMMNGLNSLCIRGTKTLLIELPMHSLKREHFDTVEQLIADGYSVLLAHIDRYFRICPNDIDELLSMGAVAQINADALSSRSSLKKIKKYLETTEKICAIGSDLHGSDPKSYKPFKKAAKTLSEYYESIMHRSGILLNGAETIKLS